MLPDSSNMIYTSNFVSNFKGSLANYSPLLGLSLNHMAKTLGILEPLPLAFVVTFTML